MKVLVIPGWYPGKYTPQNGNFYVEQVKYLKKAGVDIAVITADLDFRYYLHFEGIFKKRTFTIEEEVPTFRIFGGGLPKKNRFLLDLWTKKMIGLYEDYVAKFGRPDVVQAHNFWGGYVALQLTMQTGIPYVFTEGFSGILSGKWPNWQKKIYVDICQKASGISVVSRGLADVIEQKFYDKKCQVIPNFIDTDLFALKKVTHHKKFRFLSIGTLISLKRFDLQLEALALIMKKRVGVELFIIGSGPEKGRLEKTINRLELNDSVSIISEVEYEQVVIEMHRADTLLLTSDTETFGIVVIEAMSVGIPVIATNTSGALDIVTPETGILIPKDNVNALANAMVQMMNNYSNNYKPKEIRAYAVQKYSKEVVTAQVIKFYEQIRRTPKKK